MRGQGDHALLLLRDLWPPRIRPACLQQLIGRLFLQRAVRSIRRRLRLGLRTPLQSWTCRRLRSVRCSFRQRQRQKRRQGRQGRLACRHRPGLKQGRRKRVSAAFLQAIPGAHQRLQPALHLWYDHLFSHVEACDAADVSFCVHCLLGFHEELRPVGLAAHRPSLSGACDVQDAVFYCSWALPQPSRQPRAAWDPGCIPT